VVGEGFLYGQGTRSAEIQAVSRAGEFSKGATAYLNLEPEVYHGQAYGSAVHALKEVTYFLTNYCAYCILDSAYGDPQ
jgi:diaminohydroxyphosphoribosylaminopyrimidine deaminase/5-amino-6-(5-phosphoribosylamino)uracil reductase